MSVKSSASKSGTSLKKLLLALTGAVVAFGAGAAATVQIQFMRHSQETFEAAPFTIHDRVATADMELGKRIYSVRAGCIDCHGGDLTGAKIMEDPAMGSIWGANLTPANLSKWSDEEIARAFRYGIHRSGRSLRFMPAFDYAAMSIEDAAALVAYIRSVPAVDQPSHENTFGPVAKVLSMLGQMPVMFPAREIAMQHGFAEKPAEGTTREFGQYLANSCTGCHGEEFRGGKIPGGDPSWPKAADIRLGRDPRWTEASFKEMLKSGVSPTTGKPIRAPMPIHLLRQMNDTETTALWKFLSLRK